MKNMSKTENSKLKSFPESRVSTIDVCELGHPLCFAVGTIVKKPGAVNGNIAVREYLKITALIDHDVMDGAPAARFLSRLDELLQNACGLDYNQEVNSK